MAVLECVFVMCLRLRVEKWDPHSGCNGIIYIHMYTYNTISLRVCVCQRVFSLILSVYLSICLDASRKRRRPLQLAERF